MATQHDYHFITHWRMQATAQEVIDILSDAEDLPRWWPSVYIEVKELSPGDENGVGKYVELYTKGWLPYTLRWRFRVTEVNSPHTFTLVAEGDFVGRGIWTFEPDNDYVNITYDWKIHAEKPLLKRLSFLPKPIFSQNHLWAMQKGEESLQLELRRHDHSADQSQFPPPPPPTPNNPIKWFWHVLTTRS